MASFRVNTTQVVSATHHGDSLPRSVEAQNAGDAARIIAGEHTLDAPGPARLELVVEGNGVTSSFVAICDYQGLGPHGKENWAVQKLP